MKKSEILKHMKIDVLGTTIFISNKYFNFSYTTVSIIKEEFRNEYRYFGGLQSEYNEESEEYKRLENWLCEICELILGYRK